MISLFRHLRTKHKSQSSSPPPSKPSCVHISLQTLRDADHQDEPGHITPSPNTKSPEEAAVPDSDGKCTTCQSDKRAARIYRCKVIGGLLLPFALQALDSTIVASALPYIATAFNRPAEMNWIVSSFNLSSAAFIPFWGQMADIFGRHATIQACLVILFIGSAICFGSDTMPGGQDGGFVMLLFGRGIQGLGCAGTSVVVRIILADKVSLKENAKNWSIFSATAGLSYGIGPVIGGFLSGSNNWKWCFGINLPICAAAILVILIILRKELLGPRTIPGLERNGHDSGLGNESYHQSESDGARSSLGHWATFSARLSTIDTGGQLLFLFGFGLIILALVWGGDSHRWGSVNVLVPLCIGIALVCVFITFEWLMAPGNTLARRWPRRQPMLPWKLITNRDIGLLCYINFATGAAMYAVLYFCDIYFTGVLGNPASEAGVQLLFYTPGLGAGVYLSMVLCNRWPRKTFVPIMLGSIIEAVGIGMLTWALHSEHKATIYGMMALTGTGTALRFMPSPLHAIGFFPDHISTIMSLMALMMTFGGTLGLTIMTTVYNNKWVPDDKSLHDITKLWTNGTDTQKANEPPLIKKAVVWAFISILPIMVMCVVAAAMLGNVDITTDQKREGEEGYGKHVTHDIYLLHLLKRWRKRSGVAARNDGLEDAENLKTMSRGEGDDERAFFPGTAK